MHKRTSCCCSLHSCSGTRRLLEFLLDGSLSWTRLMTLGNTVGVLPLWRGCRGTFAVLQTGTWSTLQARYSSYRAGYFGGFLASDLVISISSVGPWHLSERGFCRHQMRGTRGYSCTIPSST
ncbi:hypothetical protein PIB30_023382 [Stylosanthes scabra]|uniref:Uncharacterized protein n=1 Tax=Stylosanthes scabra TaxID=79078 RepID=A0ABU6V7R6_9FABA|nr:hypothetical protein [Stylosanthes scabra]